MNTSAVAEPNFSPIEVIACPYCGELNESTYVHCRQCDTLLLTDAARAVVLPQASQRSGCVLVYAAFLGGTAVALVTAAIAAHDASAGWTLLLAAFEALVAFGLWRHRNWARFTVIVMQCLNVLFGLILIATGSLEGIALAAIGATIAYWFYANDQFFH
ncbi:MAG: hypothetical protein IPK16_01595 [Anaerolineales bacterium]|nr:hypothetical protein [Anaerolineales bacterium]